MTLLHTCSYGAYRPWFGQPVVASLTLPKRIPEAARWPRCSPITPRWEYFRKDPDGAAYLAQLERYGQQVIARQLEAIARQYQAGALVILCFEADGRPGSCHRGRFSSWWLETTGELITEIGP